MSVLSEVSFTASNLSTQSMLLYSFEAYEIVSVRLQIIIGSTQHVTE